MSKPPTAAKEVKVPDAQSEPAAQSTFSFLAGMKLSNPPKGATATGNALTEARKAVLDGIKVQQGHVRLLIDDKPLPKMRNSDKTVSTWFYRDTDGTHGATIRYGRTPIKLDAEHTSVVVGDLPAQLQFYNTVAEAIGKGEMDTQILEMQQVKSARLTGKTRKAS